MATYRERSGANPWQARVVGLDGRQISKSFRNKTLAKRWATAMEADLARGTYVDQRAGETVFDEYATGWLGDRKSRLARSTWQRDESYLRSLILPHFGSVRVGQILPSDLTGWLGGLDVKDSTKAKALQILRSVLERARLDKAIASNPVDDVPNKPNPKRTRRPGRALSDEELTKVIGAAYTVNEASALIVVAMGQLGLRVGEALALRRGDFDSSAGLVTVERSRDRDGSARPLKGRYEGDRRVIPLPHSVRDAYARHTGLQDSTPISGDLFVTSRSTPLIYNNWRRRQWTRIIDEANIGHVVPHDLRHTCITRLFTVDRWTPAEVQAFVGHTDARVTLEIYSHVNPAMLPVPSDLGIEIGQE